MKKITLSSILFAGLLLKLSAQCLTVTCPAPITVNNTSGNCGAVVNYSLPTMSSTCVVLVGDTFNYTGSVQTYVVPVGITTLTMETWGAQGGANWVNNTNFGGYSKGTFTVTPGETLYIYVGGQTNSATGGYNGGGAGDGVGKGGGGGSDVRQGGTALTNRIIVGGGGGGAGYWSSLHVVGGVGGGLVGGDGYRVPADAGGLGGTQTAGGANGTCISMNVVALAGSFGQGGTPFGFGCGCEGYGGGGGWYGGAGSGNCRGGGGGSGYILPSATNQTMTAGVRVGNGRVVISTIGTSTPVLTQTTGFPSGSTFPVGTTTNTFTASDAFGNSATCSFQVTVNDNELPVINSCPSNFSMCPGVCSFGNPTATDNCSATVSQTSGPTSGSSLVAGTYPIIFTAIDPTGNSSTCSFTITVNPNPSVTLDLGSLSFACLSYGAFSLAGESPLGGMWSGPGVTLSTFDPSSAGVGTHTITYTYTDVNGCSGFATDTIHVDVCTGISANGIEVFRIYPNPTTGFFWFSSMETGTLEILDANGKLVKSEKIISNKQEVDLSGLAEGTYLVKFHSAKGIDSNGQLIIQ